MLEKIRNVFYEIFLLPFIRPVTREEFSGKSTPVSAAVFVTRFALFVTVTLQHRADTLFS